MAKSLMTQQQRDIFLQELSKHASTLIRALDVVTPFEEVNIALNNVGWRHEDSGKLLTDLHLLAKAAENAKTQGGNFSV